MLHAGLCKLQSNASLGNLDLKVVVAPSFVLMFEGTEAYSLGRCFNAPVGGHRVELAVLCGSTAEQV